MISDLDLKRALEQIELAHQRMADDIRLELNRAIPLVVTQALSDTALPPACRLLMWHLRTRLDTVKYREQKLDSLVSETGFGKATVSESLARLVSDGYLSVYGFERRSRAYRLPASRRDTDQRELDAA